MEEIIQIQERIQNQALRKSSTENLVRIGVPEVYCERMASKLGEKWEGRISEGSGQLH